MVNRIGDNQYINSYVNGSRQSTSPGEKAPAFLLNYDEEGVVWDRDDNPKKDKADDASSNSSPRNAGKNQDRRKDTYEPSAVALKMEREKKLEPEVKSSVFATFRRLLTSVKQAVINAFNYVWYGNEDEKDEVKNEEKTDTGVDSYEETTDKAIKTESSSHTRYKTEFDRRLERAGRGVEGTPARNTNLLTTYDGKGNIRKISATESDIILKGDKSIKL